MENKKFKIDTEKSNINWIGRKVTGAHDGTISIKEGVLDVENDKLTGGKVIIDTTSIKILDITDQATNDQFAGHLFSEDFFAVESFPEALFQFTKVEYVDDENYLISGNLTIKDITHPVSFAAEVNIADNVINASGRFLIDRTKYNMKFRSGNFFTNLGDTLIYNEFELNLKLTATAIA